MKSISEKPGVKTSLLYGMKVVSFCHDLQGSAAMQYRNLVIDLKRREAVEVVCRLIELIHDKVVFEPEEVS